MAILDEDEFQSHKELQRAQLLIGYIFDTAGLFVVFSILALITQVSLAITLPLAFALAIVFRTATRKSKLGLASLIFHN